MNKLQSNTLLTLFSSVLHKDGAGSVFNQTHGFYLPDGGAYAEKAVEDFFQENTLSGNDLNKTFHKSWKKVRDSSRFELFVEQITHYLSTYGTDFQGETYIPDEILNVPEVKLKVKVISVLTKSQAVEKCLGMLTSGIALKEDTIDALLNLLDSLNYTFTGDEGIRNKEAVIKIAERFGVLPKNTSEFLRYVVYRATGSTLLIKNKGTYTAIEASSYNPQYDFRKFGEARLAETFNRFKPIFLAFKSKCPAVINKISKLSKTNHRALPVNPLNVVTSQKLTGTKGLEKATLFALFKALSACYSRLNGQTTFAYRIRNGKGYASDSASVNVDACKHNFKLLLGHLQDRVSSKHKVFLPDGVDYALPTSEKMFIGNIPTGTRFFGKRLAVGVYWKNSGGARDIDLSGISVSGHKVGWNGSYNHDNKLLYSGDITNAPKGAVEYLHASGEVESTLITTNVYSGQDDCEYKIIVGKGSKVSNNFMMNPNKLLAEVKTKGIQKQMVLGLLSQDGDQNSFTLLNFGAGATRVSGYGINTRRFTTALCEQWANPLSLRDVISALDWEVVETAEDADFDLSLDSLEKDTFVKIFA